MYQYGKPQDLANADLTQITLGNAGTAFDAVFPSYSMSVIVLNAPAASLTPPTIAVPASATPAPVVGTLANVSVLGNDAAGASTLTYTWSATGPAPVTFSPNGTNAARNATAVFAAAGPYTLTATVTDQAGLSVQSAVAVTVNQTLTKIKITPATASLAPGKSQQFTATGTDQFGGAMGVTPIWTVSGGGTMTSSGFFTAAIAGGPYAAKAADGSIIGTASVTVTSAAPALQINAGGKAAAPFAADRDFTGGTAYATAATISTAGVTNPAPAAVYQTQRYGNFTYTLPGLVPGAPYTLRLHLSEIYWPAAGRRLFSVQVNGAQVLTSFDVFKAAGGRNRALVESFPVTAGASGQVVVQFVTNKDNACVSGLEILH